MNEEFFKENGLYLLGETESKTTLLSFEKFNDFLPDLDDARYEGDGSDGICFSKNERVYKFGYWDDWRGDHHEFPTDVLSAEEMMHRMEKLMETQEICLPEVYRLVAFDNRRYFIEMELLPFSADWLASPDDRSLMFNVEQYSGETFFSEALLSLITPPWREWVESYQRLQALGFYHRDLNSRNIRRDAQHRPKFIDLESFVFFIGTDESQKAA